MWPSARCISGCILWTLSLQLGVLQSYRSSPILIFPLCLPLPTPPSMKNFGSRYYKHCFLLRHWSLPLVPILAYVRHNKGWPLTQVLNVPCILLSVCHAKWMCLYDILWWKVRKLFINCTCISIHPLVWSRWQGGLLWRLLRNHLLSGADLSIALPEVWQHWQSFAREWRTLSLVPWMCGVDNWQWLNGMTVKVISWLKYGLRCYRALHNLWVNTSRCTKW